MTTRIAATSVRLATPLRVSLTLAAAMLVASCTSAKRQSTASGSTTAQTAPSVEPPTFMLGNFSDDYSGSFRITREEFIQLPRGRFRIVQWNVPQQYFIAQNDSLNRSDPGKWTRIDWMPLEGMAPYRWAFCFSAWNAATRAQAESAVTAKRETPRTGCAGFPFTRMKPVD
jgi:hypothetical protein